MDLGLSGRTALIAGASRGIGLAVAECFLAEGARVVVTGRSHDSLAAAAAALRGRHGGDRVLEIAADMCDAAEISRALAETVAAFGVPDAVVANVGSGSGPRGWALDAEAWRDGLQRNFLGGMALAAEVLTPMCGRGSGSLTFISSIAGCEALDAPLPYVTAKAAIHAAVKSLSRQAGGSGVRVNAVAPGNVLFPGGSWERKLAEQPEVFRRYVEAEVPLKRFARADEIADMVVFLSSRRAEFITGSVMVVDGGQTRKF